jgi:hypothetical protein
MVVVEMWGRGISSWHSAFVFAGNVPHELTGKNLNPKLGRVPVQGLVGFRPKPQRA